eukprot:CAMPEP_0201687898 /NCGR_PEP_ID=MMETSP0578-20130828/1744_1 /ASSEMBLY_ACC=CAM_ASM_000663 /TAXON_ID=267565 /ORGANISM="Skeletonema grethea, Strain CCMP 1804" /LENGTH=568 /DNA_ID=CAMNT_0048172077 /DNA_START=24 /DNA_END=1727 /DNA_ORIENTATION=-
MSDKKSSLAKERKSNDGRAATVAVNYDVVSGGITHVGCFLSSWFGFLFGRGGASSSGASPNKNGVSQLDRMEEMMMRMEEKLATVSSLESRCERLEEKCSSLENLFESKFDTLSFDLDQKCDSLANRLEAKIDSARAQETDKALKRHEYNEMLIKNQRWEYSVPVLSMNELIYNGYTEDEAEAEHLALGARGMKIATTKMRRGEFDRERSGNEKGIELAMNLNDDHPIFNYAVNNELLPHWKEFAAALEQFTPAINLLPDNCVSFFKLDGVQLNSDAMLLVKEALIGKPFQKLLFANNDNGNNAEDLARGGMSVDAILEVVESNKHLQKLEIRRNQIDSQHIERLCSVVRNYPLVELEIFDSCAPGIGDQMLTALLTGGDLKLERLDMSHNNITSLGITILSDYLATNPALKYLFLASNEFNDSDAELIANALRTNMTLRYINLEGNINMNYDGAGAKAFRLVLCDESSLNAAADSNHMCFCVLCDYSNRHEQRQINRASKIYRLLSSRNRMLSNVNHFDDIDVKMLPNMLEAVGKYHDAVREYNENAYPRISYVEQLSIMYEIMRKW